jgi:hypothetical protein
MVPVKELWAQAAYRSFLLRHLPKRGGQLQFALWGEDFYVLAKQYPYRRVTLRICMLSGNATLFIRDRMDNVVKKDEVLENVHRVVLDLGGLSLERTVHWNNPSQRIKQFTDYVTTDFCVFGRQWKDFLELLDSMHKQKFYHLSCYKPLSAFTPIVKQPTTPTEATTNAPSA